MSTIHSPIPYLDDDEQIAIDVEQLAAHTLVQANSGGGKTRAVRRILEVVHDAAPSMPQWVIDPEGEMHTLREQFPHILCSPTSKEAVATVKTAPLLARRLLETGAHAIIDIYDLGVHKDEFLRVFFMALMDAPRTLWRDVLITIDEAQLFCPERGESEADSTEAIRYLMTNGRKRGYGVMLATQRIAAVHKGAIAQCNNRLIGRAGLDVDQARACKALGWKPARGAELATLKPGQFWAHGPALCPVPTLVQMGEVRTRHGRAVRNLPPTPPRSAALKILAELGDLPSDAETELKTVEQLRARVKELEGKAAISESWQAGDSVQLKAEIVAVRKQLAAERDASGVLRQQLFLLSGNVGDVAQKLIAIHDDLLEARSQSTRLLPEPTDGAWADKSADQVLGEIATIGNKNAEPLSDEALQHMAASKTNVVAQMIGATELAARASARKAGDGLSAMQRALLTALAQHGTLPKHKVLLHANYSATGKVSACWAQMGRDGWVLSRAGDMTITPAGLRVLGAFEPLPVGRALLAKVMTDPKLNQCERTLLQVVTDAYPRSITKGRALELAGYSATGKVSAAWAHLGRLDYIHSNRGDVIAAKELCVP